MSLGSLNLVLFTICAYLKVLALVFQILNLCIIVRFDLQELLKLFLVPLKGLFKVYDSRVLRKFGVLLSGFGLQKLQFFLNFIHVCREGKPEVVLVLAKHLYQLFIVVTQTVINVVKLCFYFVEVGD